jgi:hypothetical protein
MRERDGRFDERGDSKRSGGFGTSGGGFWTSGGFGRLRGSGAPGRFGRRGAFVDLGAARHPVAQFLSLLVIGAAVVGVVLMGAFILSFLIGAAVLASAVLAVRVWWFRRKLRSAAERAAAGHLDASGAGTEGVRESRNPHGRLIEAEYTIVRERDAGRRHQR